VNDKIIARFVFKKEFCAKIYFFFLICHSWRAVGKSLGSLSRGVEFQGQVFSESILSSDLLELHRWSYPSYS